MSQSMIDMKVQRSLDMKNTTQKKIFDTLYAKEF